MKPSRHAPSLTSLPQAPQDEVSHRVRRYTITMTIRVVCFVLMVVVQPYGWYTWLFALGAAVLPYIAVVFANAGSDNVESSAESPLQELAATPPPLAPAPEGPQILTIQENREERS